MTLEAQGFWYSVVTDTPSSVIAFGEAIPGLCVLVPAHGELPSVFSPGVWFLDR